VTIRYRYGRLIQISPAPQIKLKKQERQASLVGITAVAAAPDLFPRSGVTFQHFGPNIIDVT
jgi:hypothetical protein